MQDIRFLPSSAVSAPQLPPRCLLRRHATPRGWEGRRLGDHRTSPVGHRRGHAEKPNSLLARSPGDRRRRLHAIDRERRPRMARRLAARLVGATGDHRHHAVSCGAAELEKIARPPAMNNSTRHPCRQAHCHCALRLLDRNTGRRSPRLPAGAIIAASWMADRRANQFRRGRPSEGDFRIESMTPRRLRGRSPRIGDGIVKACQVPARPRDVLPLPLGLTPADPAAPDPAAIPSARVSQRLARRSRPSSALESRSCRVPSARPPADGTTASLVRRPSIAWRSPRFGTTKSGRCFRPPRAARRRRASRRPRATPAACRGSS